MVWEAMDTRSEVGKEIDKSGIVQTEDELRATTIAPDIQYTWPGPQKHWDSYGRICGIFTVLA